jgi:DNA-binding phage protein
MGLEGEVSQQCRCIYGETCTLSVEGYVLMPTMVIDIPAEIYKQLEAQARQAGTTPERFTRKLLETALHTPEKPKPQTIREVLQATGRVRPLSDALRRQIIPGVTLDEVRKTLSQSAGPGLSDIIDEQRGPKA